MNVDHIGFAPGDIFREYHWNGPWRIIDCPYFLWQRVTDPHSEHQGARKYLPNPVNVLYVDDLGLATKAELCIEQWGGHAATSEKKIRVNGHEWIEIPESPNMGPEPPENYLYFRYPLIPLSLDQIHEGNNDLEVTCGNQTAYKIGDVGWGQWGIYGIILRVYYSPDKPHPTGKIISPTPNSTIGERVSLQFEADESPSSDLVERVEFIGYYEDFDHNGDGLYDEWHYRFRYGQLKNHLATADTVPYDTCWDTSWIPEQQRPLKMMARVTDYHGISSISPIIEGIRLERRYNVKMYTPYDVPAHWMSRAGKMHSCKVDIPDDLDNAVAAQMVFTSWNGYEAAEIGINATKLFPRIGRNHDFAYTEVEVPLHLLKQGVNVLYTEGTTLQHGIEVLWPGMVLKVKYK